MRGRIAGFVGMVALAACQPLSDGLGDAFGGGDRLDPLYQGLEAPEDTATLRSGVDGLVVGDRLMEAGEYELALRSYYRAGAENGVDPVLLIAIGSASLALGRLGQAEDTLRDAVEQAPEEPVAWNNLGVVLMEQGAYGEASQVFRTAFALDSGRSDAIRENLRLAIARRDNSAYTPLEQDQNRYDLERRGGGRYLLVGAS